MAYQSLYRKYRPQTFEDAVGQQHIVKTLKNAINRDQIAHAYLFTGPRGTGKTTFAKLLARGVNCVNKEDAPCNHCENCLKLNSDNHPDIIEIDAASNNGVNDVREIIEKVKYAPIQAKYKVYIIDEVHMLSQGAFNALLKTLEEPPKHVIFILATTEVHKVLPTIISRTQRYDFSRVSTHDLVKRINYVLSQEQIEANPDAVLRIAQLADGGFRDALTILEQVIAYSDLPISIQDIEEVYKISSPAEKKKYLQALCQKDLTTALDCLKQAENKSIDYKRYIFDLIDLCKETLISKIVESTDYVSTYNEDAVYELQKEENTQQLHEIINSLLKIQTEAKFNGFYQNYLEIATINLCQKEAETKVVEPTKPKPRLAEEKKVKPKPIDLETKEISIPNHSEKPTLEIQELEELNQQQIMALMALGNKTARQKEAKMLDDAVFQITDMNYRKIQSLLKQSKIGVSTSNHIILMVSKVDLSITKIGENNQLLQQFIYDHLNHKTVHFVEEETFKSITNDYVAKLKAKSLPTKEESEKIVKSLQKYQPTALPTTQEILIDLFGDFKVEE